MVGLRTRLKRMAIGILGRLPGLLRLAEVGPLSKKAGARATAIGTRRIVRVVSPLAVEGLLGEFRELAQEALVDPPSRLSPHGHSNQFDHLPGPGPG